MLAEAARRLDIAFALTGELLRAGERVRITTQLVALPTERVRQSAQFDESIGDLSNLPQAIALKAIDALDLKPVVAASKAAPSSGYEMYVLGIDAMRAKTPESIERARRYFSQGIEIDALYARNYSGLGSSWIVQYEVGGGRLERREAFARAEPLYAKALQLDPELVDARLGVANVARQYQRFDEARRGYEAVLQTHPNNIQARFGLGLTEEDDGWPSRAVVQYDRAAALDPTHFLIPMRAGLALMYLGRLAEAEARFKRSIELDSARPNGFYSLGILNWLRGQLDESVAAYREALKRGEQASYIWADYAFLCIDLGLYDEARRAFERTASLLRAPNSAAVNAAFVWVAEGAPAPAPKALEDTVASPAPWERLLILAMAGERPSSAAVSAVESEQASYLARGHYAVRNRLWTVSHARCGHALRRRRREEPRRAVARRGRAHAERLRAAGTDRTRVSLSSCAGARTSRRYCSRVDGVAARRRTRLEACMVDAARPCSRDAARR